MSVLYFKTRLVDRGEGPNLMSKHYLRTHWKCCIKHLHAPKLRTAMKESIEVKGIILLIVNMRNLRVSKWWEVLENLAVHILHGATYINPCIKRIFPVNKISYRYVLPPYQSLTGQTPVQDISDPFAQGVKYRSKETCKGSGRETGDHPSRNRIPFHCTDYLQRNNDNRTDTDWQADKQMATCAWNIWYKVRKYVSFEILVTNFSEIPVTHQRICYWQLEPSLKIR